MVGPDYKWEKGSIEDRILSVYVRTEYGRGKLWQSCVEPTKNKLKGGQWVAIEPAAAWTVFGHWGTRDGSRLTPDEALAAGLIRSAFDPDRYELIPVEDFWAFVRAQAKARRSSLKETFHWVTKWQPDAELDPPLPIVRLKDAP